jgi:hypothetical protein
MNTVMKAWQWLSGKKTTIGASITLAAGVVSLAATTLPAFGVDADHVALYVGYGTMAVGLLHKAYKALFHEDLPEN